jgi:hypothetical protein
MRNVLVFVMFALGCSEPPLGQTEGTSSEESVIAPFCDVAHSRPAMDASCLTIEGDFSIASDGGAGCLVHGRRYSCLSTRESLYYDGTFEITDHSALDAPCGGCDGTESTVISEGSNVMFEYTD